MPAQFLKDRVLAAAGPLPGQLTIENMKRWTTLRKGVFLEDFDDNVTHLLCTKEQFDKKVPRGMISLKIISSCSCLQLNSQGGTEAQKSLHCPLRLVRVLDSQEQKTGRGRLFHEDPPGEGKCKETREGAN
jgi:hypothetical protein